MTRRASLPGVDELFRSSKPAEADVAEETNIQGAKAPDVVPLAAPAPAPPAAPAPAPTPAAATPAPEPVVAAPPPPPVPAPSPVSEPAAAAERGRRPRPERPRHEEKVTFYCTASELTRIERARLALRADHRLGTDRGRIVRAALTEILDDFEARGSDSLLVARLRELNSE